MSQESDEQESDEDLPNEVPSPVVKDSFVDNLMRVKDSLYTAIVTPDMDPSRKEAQDVGLLQKYEVILQRLEQFLVHALFHPLDREPSLDTFPDSIQESIQELMEEAKNNHHHALSYQNVIHQHCFLQPYLRNQQVE